MDVLFTVLGRPTEETHRNLVGRCVECAAMTGEHIDISSRNNSIMTRCRSREICKYPHENTLVSFDPAPDLRPRCGQIGSNSDGYTK